MNNKKNIKLNRKEKIIAVAIIFVLIVSMFIGISGCGKKENNMQIVEDLLANGQENVMLFDYLERVVGTEKEQGYYEIVLYAIPGEEGALSTEEVRMDVYTDGGLRSEKMISKNVPYATFEKVMEIITENKVRKWADMEEDELISYDGCDYICKFPAVDQYMRISSEAMPEDGMEVFSAILEALQAEYTLEN